MDGQQVRRQDFASGVEGLQVACEAADDAQASGAMRSRRGLGTARPCQRGRHGDRGLTTGAQGWWWRALGFPLPGAGGKPVDAGGASGWYGPVEIAVEAWLTVRTAVPSDLEDLRRIYRAASLSNEGDAPALLERPEFLVFEGDGVASGRTLIAMADGPAGGTATGFATITTPAALHPGAGAELDDLFVDPRWRRRGIARHLVHQIVVMARDGGHQRLWVTGNHHALPFYRAVGFLRTGQVATALGSGVRMSLDVGTPSVAGA